MSTKPRSPKNITIDHFFKYSTGFKRIFADSCFPWTTDEATSLYFAYLESSGGKYLAPFMYRYTDSAGNFELDTPPDSAAEVRSIMSIKFGDKWNHLYPFFKNAPNPLNPFNYSDTTSRTLTRTSAETTEGNKTDSGSETESTTRTDNLTESVTTSSSSADSGNDSTQTKNTGTETTVNKVSAYNSSAFQDKEQTTVTPNTTSTETTTYGKQNSVTGSETTGNTGTQTHATTISNDRTNEYSEDKSGTLEDIETISHTITGNRGDSPQELIAKDIDLWSDPFFAIVIKDIDSVFALPYFSDERPEDIIF